MLERASRTAYMEARRDAIGWWRHMDESTSRLAPQGCAGGGYRTRKPESVRNPAAGGSKLRPPSIN